MKSKASIAALENRLAAFETAWHKTTESIERHTEAVKAILAAHAAFVALSPRIPVAGAARMDFGLILNDDESEG